MADYTRIINEGLFDSDLLTSGGENFKAGIQQFVVTRGGEQITFADSMASMIDELNALQETVTYSDVINRLQLDKVFTDTLSASESLLNTLGRDSSDSASFQDTISTILDRVQTLSDGISHSDSLVKQVQLILSDSFNTADSLQQTLSWLKTHSDTLTTADSTLRIYTWLKTLSDAVTLADTIVQNVDRVKALSDTSTFADSIDIRDLTVILTDTLQAQEQLERLIKRFKTDDTITFLDTTTKTIDRVLALSESIGFTDTHGADSFGALSDSVAFTDSVFSLYDWVREVSETVSMSDSIQYTVDLIKSDSFATSESISELIGNFNALSDQLSFADSETLTIDRVQMLLDTGSFSDTFIKQVHVVLNDTFDVAETILATIMRPITESITLIDSFAKTIVSIRTLSESIQFSDSGADARSILKTPTGESVTLDDSVAVQITLLLLDSHGVTEVLTQQAIRTLAQSEGISLSDSVAKTIIHVYNSIAFVKTGNPYTDMVTGKARLTPISTPFYPKQVYNKADGGVVQVASIGDADELFVINLDGLSRTVIDNLIGFLSHSTVNYGQNVFTLITEGGETGVGTAVRLWNANVVHTPHVKGGLYNIRLTLRKEMAT